MQVGLTPMRANGSAAGRAAESVFETKNVADIREVGLISFAGRQRRPV
jgi:hypothetical protein